MSCSSRSVRLHTGKLLTRVDMEESQLPHKKRVLFIWNLIIVPVTEKGVLTAALLTLAPATPLLPAALCLQNFTLFLVSDQRATTSSKRKTTTKKPKMTSAEEEQEGHSEEDKPKKKRNVQGNEEQWVYKTSRL